MNEESATYWCTIYLECVANERRYEEKHKGAWHVGVNILKSWRMEIEVH